MASGHGSAFRYDGSDPDRPTILLTREEALAKALWWVRHADTIGGQAKVIHVPTGEEISMWEDTDGEA